MRNQKKLQKTKIYSCSLSMDSSSVAAASAISQYLDIRIPMVVVVWGRKASR